MSNFPPTKGGCRGRGFERTADLQSIFADEISRFARRRIQKISIIEIFNFGPLINIKKYIFIILNTLHALSSGFLSCITKKHKHLFV